jgi:predicted transposase YdaD
MLLTTLPDDNALTKAKLLIQQLQQLPDSRAIIEMISTIMVYKFTNLTRAEVEAMIGITLQETRVYRDAKAEGKAEGVSEGRQAEAQSMILRQLSRRFGMLSPDVNTVVMALSVAKLEDLGEALLDFQEIADLTGWLQANQ